MVRFGIKSDKGIVRDINEDSCRVLVETRDYPTTVIVADGMGGHNSGEIASNVAVNCVCREVSRFLQLLSKEKDPLLVIKKIMESANSKVFLESQKDNVTQGMGTTLIVTMIYNDKLLIGHVGDSRVYVIRNGDLNQITTDHSYIEELIKLGSLTREQAQNHPNKNIITRALGCYENIQVDTYSYMIEPGDIILMCTDGLTNMVSNQEIIKMASSFTHPQELCNNLVEAANQNGGEDNISVIVLMDFDFTENSG